MAKTIILLLINVKKLFSLEHKGIITIQKCQLKHETTEN